MEENKPKDPWTRHDPQSVLAELLLKSSDLSSIVVVAVMKDGSTKIIGSSPGGILQALGSFHYLTNVLTAMCLANVRPMPDSL